MFCFIQGRNLHKEELTKSETEKAIHNRVQQNAPVEQSKRAKHQSTSTKTTSKVTSSCSSEKIAYVVLLCIRALLKD